MLILYLHAKFEYVVPVIDNGEVDRTSGVTRNLIEWYRKKLHRLTIVYNL